MTKKIFSIVFLICALVLNSGNPLYSQPTPKKHKKCKTCNDKGTDLPGQFKKGEFYLSWGYNRAFYSKSDIHFIGLGSDFTFSDVVAKDRPTPFNFQDYFVAITIPQFVASGGYFFRDNWALSFNTDHMKYVMVNDQESILNGNISSTSSSSYAGTYQDKPMVISDTLLRYEHTNGLNYINIGLDYYHSLWKSTKNQMQLAFVPGIDVAMLYPRSDVDLFNIEGSNVFHVAGWGASLRAGLRFNLTKNLYLLWNNKGGFIGLPNVLCDINKYKAEQHFFFYQTAFSLGYSFRF